MKKQKKLQPKSQLELQGRKTWEVNPVQRVQPNKKAYNRKKMGKVRVTDYA